jgi:molybdopterin converting factor small subunit
MCLVYGALLGKDPLMRVKIRSIFAIGTTDHSSSRFASGKDLVVEVEPGSHVQELLKKFPSLGPPDAFDDMMMHVFVNGKQVPFDYVLQPEDIVDIHIPSSGG